MSIYLPFRGKFDDSYWDIVSNGFPITLSVLVEIIILTINISYVSSGDAKSALGVSWALMHSFGASLILGFNYGYATFASRAFGAINKQKFKLFFVQGLMNLCGLIGLLIVVSLFSKKICISVGQEPEIAHIVQTFILTTLPGNIFFYLSNFIRVTLNCQDVYKPNMIVDGSCIVIHLIVCKILSYFLHDNYLVIAATNITLFLYLIGTIIVEHYYSRWKISRQILNVPDPQLEYREFFIECCYIGVPISLDFFVLEFMTLFVGAFQNTPETAANVILTTVYLIIASVYLGFSLFMVTRIGNLVGENSPKAILNLVKRVFKLTTVFVYSIYVVVYYFQDDIFNFYYREEQEIVKYTRPVMKLFGIFFIFDASQYIASNFYKPLGFGSWVIKVFFISFYLVGLGSMFLFSFALQLKILCAWGGNLLACVTEMVIYIKKSTEINVGEIVEKLNDKVKKDLEVKEVRIQLKDYVSGEF